MRVVFLGSGDFACPVVASIHDAGWLVAAVTQPDRPAGRNRQLTPCPVKALLEGRGVDVWTPERVADTTAQIEALRPDLLVVTDYGQYIPSRLVNLAPLRAVNVHPSLLPLYRGAAPIPWAIANGDAATGVTIQLLAKQMDTGDLLAQERFVIGPDETAPQLEARLAGEGARMLGALIPELAAGRATARSQDDTAATHARKLTKEDAVLDWAQPAEVLARRVRAFQSWPGQATSTPRGRVKVWQAKAEPGAGEPGAVLEVGNSGIRVAAGQGTLRLLVVQPEGRPQMAAGDYARGARLASGERWGA